MLTQSHRICIQANPLYRAPIIHGPRSEMISLMLWAPMFTDLGQPDSEYHQPQTVLLRSVHLHALSRQKLKANMRKRFDDYGKNTIWSLRHEILCFQLRLVRLSRLRGHLRKSRKKQKSRRPLHLIHRKT